MLLYPVRLYLESPCPRLHFLLASRHESIQRLIHITASSMCTEASGLRKIFANIKQLLFRKPGKNKKTNEGVSDLSQFALATAQRVDHTTKIAASVR